MSLTAALTATLTGLWSARQRETEQVELSRAERWTDTVRRVADGEADEQAVFAILLELGKTPDDLVGRDGRGGAVQCLQARRDLAHLAEQRSASEIEVQEIGTSLAQFDRDHEEAERAFQEQRRALVSQLHDASILEDRSRRAAAEILRTTPLAPRIAEVRGQLASVRAPMQNLEQVASLRSSARESDERARQLSTSPDHRAQPMIVAAKEHAKNCRCEALRIEAEVAGIDEREAELVAEIERLERDVIESAIRGELPMPPPEPEPAMRREINMVGRGA